MRKVGVDVSRYNGRPNWSVAKANGVDFAILRAVSGASGVYIDPTFEYNYSECKRAGVPVGLYVASYLNVDKEIAVTERLIRGKQFEYPIYYDVEDFSFTGRTRSKQSATYTAVKFCKHFEKLGYYVGIYSNKYFIDQWLDRSQIKDFDIWIADWRKGVDYSKSYGMHQFTNKGRFRGINSTGEGGVDSNYCYTDYPSIMRKHGLNGFKKENIAPPKTNTNPETSGDKNLKYVTYNNSVDKAQAERIATQLGYIPIDLNNVNKLTKDDFIVHVGGGINKYPSIVLKGSNRAKTDKVVTEYINKILGGK